MRWGAPPPRGGGGWGGGGGNYNILGLYIPRVIVWLIALALFMSAGGSLLTRSGVPLLNYTLLEPLKVWRGELWRLVTWAPIELRPVGLLFGCVALFFFGSDLVHRWGTKRFLGVYFGCAAVTGLLTSLVALIWPAATIPHMGLWPMQEALIIAWAVMNPGGQILVYFVLPIGSRHLITLTIGITVVFAALMGFNVFLPHFIAEAVALVYMDVFSFRRTYLRARLAVLERQQKRRVPSHLRAVDRDDEPPRWTH
jgi:membrane associated rhomboid family serine protease